MKINKKNSKGSKQCSQNIFAYGFPHEGRGDSNKEQNKEIRKDCIIYPSNTNPSPHTDGHSLRKFP